MLRQSFNVNKFIRTTFNGIVTCSILVYFIYVIITSQEQKIFKVLHQKCRYIRSSHRRCSLRKRVIRNFSKFTGKHLCQSFFFNKVQAFNFIKKETLTQAFSCEFCEISSNTSFAEHLWATASDIFLTK